MSAFTDRIHGFFSKFFEVSKEDLSVMEKAVEEKVAPLVQAAKDEAKAGLTDMETRVKDLESKVEALLGNKPAA